MRDKLILAALLSSSVLFGQTTRGVLVGTVTDQSGATVPAAEVTVTNQQTNIATRVATAGEGQYTVTNLDPGTYRVSVTAPGFRTTAVSDIVLNVSQTARVDVRLEVGDVATVR